MTTARKYRRCPHSDLTEFQAHLLSCAALGRGHYDATPDPLAWPKGIIRSLIIRGLLDGKRRLTDEGKTALARCCWLSPGMKPDSELKKSVGDKRPKPSAV